MKIRILILLLGCFLMCGSAESQNQTPGTTDKVVLSWQLYASPSGYKTEVNFFPVIDNKAKPENGEWQLLSIFHENSTQGGKRYIGVIPAGLYAQSSAKGIAEYKNFSLYKSAKDFKKHFGSFHLVVTLCPRVRFPGPVPLALKKSYTVFNKILPLDGYKKYSFKLYKSGKIERKQENISAALYQKTCQL